MRNRKADQLKLVLRLVSFSMPSAMNLYFTIYTFIAEGDSKSFPCRTSIVCAIYILIKVQVDKGCLITIA